MADKKVQSEDEQSLIPAAKILEREESEIPDEIKARWKQQKNTFLEWIEHQENLDVYQVASVLYQTTGLRNPETWKAILKVFVCSALQILGMVYLCCYFMFLQDSEEEAAGLTGFDKYCRMNQGSPANDSVPLKLLSIFFAAWISLVLADQIVDVSSYGLYSFGTQQPVFVNNFIIYLGLFTNFFVSMICWLSSMALMYFSDNVIDLILNGLALYFIKEIDDEMVFGHDYAMIEKWFQDKYDIFVNDYIRNCDETDKDERASFWYKDCCGGEVIVHPSRCWCILSPLVIIAPLYLAICY